MAMVEDNFRPMRIPEKFKMFIFYKSGSYAVKNDRNSILITFGRFRFLDVACAAASLLIKYDWNIFKVKDDPIIKYNNEFWLFKVMNNKLIFDSKFDSYEKAVESSEINLRCNDYHNNIFKSSIINKENEKISEPKYDIADDKYIRSESGKFVIRRSNREDSAVRGVFDSFDQAIAARKILLEHNWRISDGMEIIFLDNIYWVFEVLTGILTYKGKFQSYEDALDIVASLGYQEKITNSDFPFPSKNSSPKPAVKSDPFEDYGYYVKIKGLVRKKPKSIRSRRIWEPSVKYIPKSGEYKINVFRSFDKSNELMGVLELKIVKFNIDFKVDGERVSWENKYDLHLDIFPDYELILYILDLNGWDLNKVKEASSIYFYENLYYKIQVSGNDKIILKSFSSYEKAERKPFINKKRTRRYDMSYSKDIDAFNGKFELVKFYNGKLIKINPIKSLEKIKAVRDILIHCNWDTKILKKYEIFYLNGIYWRLKYSNNTVNLLSKL